MNEQEQEIIVEKLNFFLNQKTKAHVLKTDGTFLNGYIFERLKERVFLMKEDELGIIHLFASETKRVDAYRDEIE